MAAPYRFCGIWNLPIFIVRCGAGALALDMDTGWPIFRRFRWLLD